MFIRGILLGEHYPMIPNVNHIDWAAIVGLGRSPLLVEVGGFSCVLLRAIVKLDYRCRLYGGERMKFREGPTSGTVWMRALSQRRKLSLDWMVIGCCH